MTKWAGSKKGGEKPGFFGGFPSYMVGSLKQIEWRSGCLLVYNDINASVYPPFSTLLYYSPSSSFFPLFVVRSRFALISRLHPFLLDFPILPSPFFLFLLFHSFSRVCTNDRACNLPQRVLWTRIVSSVSLTTYNKIVKRHSTFVFHMDNTFLHRGCFHSLLFPSTKPRRDVGYQQFSHCIALHCFRFHVRSPENRA